MLTALIDLSLKNRFLVIALFGLMAVGGIYSATQIPIDAVPDMTNTQGLVLTEAPGLSPIEVEQYETYPVEATMRSLPHVIEARSVSKLLLRRTSTPTARARQRSGEKISTLRSEPCLTDGLSLPTVGLASRQAGQLRHHGPDEPLPGRVGARDQQVVGEGGAHVAPVVFVSVAEGRSDTPGVGQLQQPPQDPQRPDQHHVGREGQDRLEPARGPVVLGEPAGLDPLAEGGHEGVDLR